MFTDKDGNILFDAVRNVITRSLISYSSQRRFMRKGDWFTTIVVGSSQPCQSNTRGGIHVYLCASFVLNYMHEWDTHQSLVVYWEASKRKEESKRNQTIWCYNLGDMVWIVILWGPTQIRSQLWSSNLLITRGVERSQLMPHGLSSRPTNMLSYYIVTKGCLLACRPTSQLGDA